MKKIRDISTSSYEESIDMRDPNRVQQVYSKLDPDREILQDIWEKNAGDIVLRLEQKIRVEKKSGKHFDALETRGAFSRIFSMKDITLKREKQENKIFPYILSLRRYIDSLWNTGKAIIIISFVVFCIFSWAITKALIENRVNSGYEKLLLVKAWGEELTQVQKNVNNARFDLLFADILFTPFKVFPGNKIDSVDYVISGGRHLSRGLDDILALYSKIDWFIQEKSLNQIYFTQLFLNIYPNLKDIEKSFEKSLFEYQKVSWLPSQQLNTTKDNGIEKIQQLLSYISIINTRFTDFIDILGHQERKRYLIVFQNADEIRPTGGFMGSMWLLEVFRWRVQLFQKKDVYAIEWDLKKAEYERLPAPKWIWELTDTFGLRDANYYVNLKDSSNTIKFFTDRAGIDLDGIVYINQNILLRLLDLSGPVYFEPLGIEITSDNFSEVMSLSVEAKTFKQGTLGTPKQVLFDFMEIFTQKLIDDGAYFDYLQALIHDVESRDIMMWSFNQQHNDLLSRLWVNGEIDYDSSLDFIYPVYTSLSWNKSDRYTRREYSMIVNRQEDSCDYDITAQIKSVHNMPKKRRDFVQDFIERESLDTPNLFEIQWAARNRQFVRIILPNAAIIQEQEGTEIVDYGSRKWIEFFLETPEQQAAYYDFSYTLENPECQQYDFTLYKQSWIPDFDVELQIDTQSFEYNSLKEDFYFKQRK